MEALMVNPGRKICKVECNRMATIINHNSISNRTLTIFQIQFQLQTLRQSSADILRNVEYANMEINALMPMVTQISELVNRIQQAENQCKWDIIRCPSQTTWWKVWICKICNSQVWWCRTKWASQLRASTWTLTCTSTLNRILRTHNSKVWCQINSCTCKISWECRCKHITVAAFLPLSTSKTSRSSKTEPLNK